jgi:hypothetical protein
MIMPLLLYLYAGGSVTKLHEDGEHLEHEARAKDGSKNGKIGINSRYCRV